MVPRDAATEAFCTQAKALGITHHAPQVIEHYLTQVVFRGVGLRGKRMLDIGGGRGLCTYFAALQGAARADNVEPLLAGSEGTATATFQKAKAALGAAQANSINATVQEFVKHCEMYDVILLHDSINHLDEASYKQLHKSQAALDSYISLFKSIAARHSPGGTLIVTDCARRNFFGDLGLRSPFAPSIEWQLHQNPERVAAVLRAAGYTDIEWRWTPLKRAGALGRAAAMLGRAPSYFLQSHFVLTARTSVDTSLRSSQRSRAR